MPDDSKPRIERIVPVPGERSVAEDRYPRLPKNEHTLPWEQSVRDELVRIKLAGITQTFDEAVALAMDRCKETQERFFNSISEDFHKQWIDAQKAGLKYLWDRRIIKLPEGDYTPEEQREFIKSMTLESLRRHKTIDDFSQNELDKIFESTAKRIRQQRESDSNSG